MDKIKTLFRGTRRGVAGETSVSGAEPGTRQQDTPYGKDLGLSKEEKDARMVLLTPRELEVFGPLVEGYTLKEVAKQLGVSYSTVNTHQAAIYKKLGVNFKAELIINFRKKE